MIVLKPREHLNVPECHVELYRPWLPRSQGQPGQEFKGQTKCGASLPAEKVIFRQSISNDDGVPEGINALLLSGSMQQKNMVKEESRSWVNITFL